MFTIISIMFTGIGIGYLLRDLRFLQKVGQFKTSVESQP